MLKYKKTKFFRKRKTPKIIFLEKYIRKNTHEEFANTKNSFYYLNSDLNFYFYPCQPSTFLFPKNFKKIKKSIKLRNPILNFKFSFFYMMNYRSRIDFFKLLTKFKKPALKNWWGWNKSFISFSSNIRITGGDFYYYKFGLFFFFQKYFKVKSKKNSLKTSFFFIKIIFQNYWNSFFFIPSSFFFKAKKKKAFWSYWKVWIIRYLKSNPYFSDILFYSTNYKKLILNWNLLYFLLTNINDTEIFQFRNKITKVDGFQISEKIWLLTRDHSNNFTFPFINNIFLLLIEHFFPIKKWKSAENNFWINFFFLIYVITLSKFNIRRKYKWFLGNIFSHLWENYFFFYSNCQNFKFFHLNSYRFKFWGLEWNSKRYLKKDLNWRYVYTWFLNKKLKKKYFFQKNIFFLIRKKTFTFKNFLYTKNFSFSSINSSKTFISKYLNNKKKFEIKKISWKKIEIYFPLYINFMKKNFFYINNFVFFVLSSTLLLLHWIYKWTWKINFYNAFWKTINFTSFPFNSNINLSLLINTYINLDLLTTLKSFGFFSTSSLMFSLFILKLWKRKKKNWIFKTKYNFFFNSFSLKKKFYFNKHYLVYERMQKSLLLQKNYLWEFDSDLFLNFIFTKHKKSLIVSKAYYCEFMHLYFEFGFIEYEKAIETMLKFTVSELKLTALTDFLKEMHRKKINPGNVRNSPTFTDLDEYFLYYKWGLEFELFKFTRHLVSNRYFGLPEKIYSNNLIKEKFFLLNEFNLKKHFKNKNLQNKNFKYSSNFYKKLLSNNNKMLELFRLHFSLTISSVWDSYWSQWIQIENFLSATNYKPFYEKNVFFDFFYSVLYRYLSWKHHWRHFIKQKLPEKIWLGDYFFFWLFKFFSYEFNSDDILPFRSFFIFVLSKLFRIQKFNLNKWMSDYYVLDQLRFTIFKAHKSFFFPKTLSIDEGLVPNSLYQNCLSNPNSFFSNYFDIIFIENKNNLFRNSFFINLKPFFLKEYYFLNFSFKKIFLFSREELFDINFNFFFLPHISTFSEKFYFNLIKNIFISLLNNLLSEFFFEQFIIFFNKLELKLEVSNKTHDLILDDKYSADFYSNVFSYNLFTLYSKQLADPKYEILHFIYIHSKFIDYLNINLNVLLKKFNLILKFNFFSSSIFWSLFEKNIKLNTYLYFYKVKLVFFKSFLNSTKFWDHFLWCLLNNLNYQCSKHCANTNKNLNFWKSFFSSFYQNENFLNTKLFFYNFIIILCKNTLK